MNNLEPTSVRTLLSWSLLCLLLLAPTLPAQLAPGFDAENPAGGGKYPINGIHPRSASQILRVETDHGEGSPLVQRLFKVETEQDCEYITVRRDESSWSATQAVPEDFVKIYSDAKIIVYINPECACDPHGQELELLSVDAASGAEVRLRRVLVPEKGVYSQELYNGENLLDLPLGATSRMNLSQVPDSTEFSLQAEACDPDCTNPDSSLVIQSYDSRAIVLLHGDNVEEKAVAKGLTLGQAQQRQIGGAALAPYIDVNGNIDFGADADYKLVIVYEQDGIDITDANWAFDDQVEEMIACGGVMEDTPASPVVFNLRQDDTGVDASCWNLQTDACTDGQLKAGSAASMTHAIYERTLAKLQVAAPTTITGLKGVATNINDDWINLNPVLSVWSSESAAAITPFAGDVHQDDTSVALLSTTPPFFGGVSGGSTNYPYRYLEFTFTPFQLLPGTYWINIMHDGNIHMGIGGLLWSLTLTDLSSDRLIGNQWPGQSMSFTNDFGITPGTLAIDVYGYQQ